MDGIGKGAQSEWARRMNGVFTLDRSSGYFLSIEQGWGAEYFEEQGFDMAKKKHPLDFGPALLCVTTIMTATRSRTLGAMGLPSALGIKTLAASIN